MPDSDVTTHMKSKECISAECHTRIMQRVQGIWFMKRVLPFILLEVGVFVFAVYTIASRVWVSHVMENLASAMKGGVIGKVWSFTSYAFMHTELFVQLAILGSLVAAVLFVAHFFTAIRQAIFITPMRNFYRK